MLPQRCFNIYHGFLQLYRTNERCCIKNGTKVYPLRSLFSVKYYFNELTESERKGITEVSKPETLANLYGFEYVDTQNGFNIYENKYYVPMGFTYDYYCLDSDIQKASEVDKTSMLMKALVLTPEQAAKYNNILSYYSFKVLTTQQISIIRTALTDVQTVVHHSVMILTASTPRSTLTRITLCSSQFHMMTAGAQR